MNVTISPGLTEVLTRRAQQRQMAVEHLVREAVAWYLGLDEALIDERLSTDMEALLRLVTLGSAARNSVKIKVRQPLADLKVQGGEAERRAVERFAGQLCEELNLKRASWHDPAAGPLLSAEVKANLKTFGPKFTVPPGVGVAVAPPMGVAVADPPP